MTIRGTVPSKSNGYKIITIGGHSSLGKTAALKRYEADFFAQCKHRGAMVDEYFTIHLDVFYPSKVADLDNSLKTILDCLQYCKVIKNDRKCVGIVARRFVDKADPRVEITLTVHGSEGDYTLC